MNRWRRCCLVHHRHWIPQHHLARGERARKYSILHVQQCVVDIPVLTVLAIDSFTPCHTAAHNCSGEHCTLLFFASIPKEPHCILSNEDLSGIEAPMRGISSPGLANSKDRICIHHLPVKPHMLTRIAEPPVAPDPTTKTYHHAQYSDHGKPMWPS